MTAFQLMLKEIGFRRISFVGSVLAVVVAAALFVTGPTLVSGYAADTQRQVEQQNRRSAEKLAAIKNETKQKLDALEDTTRVTMRDLGFNLNILHKDTNLGDLYTEYKVVDMPEEYVYRLANAEEIDMVRHVVAFLTDKIKWNGRTVVFTGLTKEVHQSHMTRKKPMIREIEPGQVLVGYELAQSYRGGEEPLEAGDTIEIEGPGGTFSFEVIGVRPEQGTRDDITLAVHLADAQKVLDRPGKISQIIALNCHCEEGTLANIREQLSRVLPDTFIKEHHSRRIARAEQRDAVKRAGEETYQLQLEREQQALAELKEHREGIQGVLATLVGVFTPLVVLVAAAFVGLMLWNNVRERRTEIGILRALGKGRSMVAALFMGKAVAVGIVGGIAGCALGYMLVALLGGAFDVPSGLFRPKPWILFATVLGAPVVAALASYLPTAAAVQQDPAIVLQDR